MTAINPHLTPTTYGEIKPGDRVVKWPLTPIRPDVHLIARPVAEIVNTYRVTGFDDHGITKGAGRFEYYDYKVIVWRDTNGSLFEDRADETVYIAPASDEDDEPETECERGDCLGIHRGPDGYQDCDDRTI